jgi:hypothetical protein
MDKPKILIIDDEQFNVHYLKKAGAHARLKGKHQEALKYYNQAFMIQTRGGVLSEEYYPAGYDPSP